MFNTLSGICGQRGPVAVSILFQVMDPDGCPVQGAVFTLSCGCGRYINAMSGPKGWTCFRGVCPGCYELTQIAVPFGFILPEAEPYCVEVARGGGVKIGELPSRCFHIINMRAPAPPTPQSPLPVMHPITADTLTITGNGSPGCTIELTFPEGVVCCTYVRRDTSWSADIPCEGILEPGDTVKAVQICKGKLPSAPASRTVPLS